MRRASITIFYDRGDTIRRSAPSRIHTMDDDMDFVMPRADYERFIQLFEEGSFKILCHLIIYAILSPMILIIFPL